MAVAWCGALCFGQSKCMSGFTAIGLKKMISSLHFTFQNFTCVWNPVFVVGNDSFQTSDQRELKFCTAMH